MQQTLSSTHPSSPPPPSPPQFHDFTIFRTKVQAKSDEEAADDKAQLADNPQIWNVHIVLNVLHSLVSKSNINDQLEVFKQGGDPREVAGPFGSRPLYQMLGYFSLVGLLRLQSLLGALRGGPRAEVGVSSITKGGAERNEKTGTETHQKTHQAKSHTAHAHAVFKATA